MLFFFCIVETKSLKYPLQTYFVPSPGIKDFRRHNWIAFFFNKSGHSSVSSAHLCYVTFKVMRDIRGNLPSRWLPAHAEPPPPHRFRGYHFVNDTRTGSTAPFWRSPVSVAERRGVTLLGGNLSLCLLLNVRYKKGRTRWYTPPPHRTVHIFRKFFLELWSLSWSCT